MAYRKTTIAAILGGTVAAASLIASAASADVVCNKWGECWRVHERYTTYPADLGVTFYADPDWDAYKHHHHVHWFERQDDNGYYDEHGHWIVFEAH